MHPLQMVYIPWVCIHPNYDAKVIVVQNVSAIVAN